MNNTIHHADHRGQGHTHEISRVERKLIDLMLNGMGDPRLLLHLWDGSTITHHDTSNSAMVLLKSRSALWRFLFHPEFALLDDASSKGIELMDATHFREAMRESRQSLPGETQMVNQLLRIDSKKEL
jgi:hypothetical protein